MKNRAWFIGLFFAAIASFIIVNAAQTNSSPTPSTSETNNDPFKENTHYRVVNTNSDPSQATDLTAYFWYGCPHCRKFDPILEDWLGAQDKPLTIKHEHPVLSTKWIPHARIFYALKSMGIDTESSENTRKVFTLVQDEKLAGDALIHAVAKSFDLDSEKFSQKLNTKDVDLAIREVKNTTESMGLRGVPALVVKDKYLILSENVTSYQQILDITSFLLNK